MKQICGISCRLFESTNQLSSFPLLLIVIVVSTVPVSPSSMTVYDAYVECACIFVCRGVQTACYFVRMCNSHSEILQYSSETLCKIWVNWSNLQNVLSEKLYFICKFGVDVTNIRFILQQCMVMQLQLSTQP